MKYYKDQVMEGVEIGCYSVKYELLPLRDQEADKIAIHTSITA